MKRCHVPGSQAKAVTCLHRQARDTCQAQTLATTTGHVTRIQPAYATGCSHIRATWIQLEDLGLQGTQRQIIVEGARMVLPVLVARR